MKNKLIVLIICCGFLQSCSWIVRFFVVNTTTNPVTLEFKLTKNANTFPIFHYRALYLHEGDGKKVNWEKQKEIIPDTLEDYSHLKVVLPAHSTIEFGRLYNDKYEKYNQYFINGRVFNLESLIVRSVEKETKIIPSTFDNYFTKNKGEVFYFVR